MLNWGRKKPTREPPVLDHGFLKRLTDHLGAKLVRELLADGLIEITDRLERLAEQAGSDKRRPALQTSHDIAGLAGHIGLSALSRSAVELNRAARNDPLAPIAELARPVLEAGPPAVEALRLRIEEDKPAENPDPA
ncbi:MAG: Hpt domain-containing protein [Pseudomonadota bacterium]